MRRTPVLVHNTHIIHTTTHTHTQEGRVSSLPLLPGLQGYKPSAYSRTYSTARWAGVTVFKKTNTICIHLIWDSNPKHLGCEPSVLTITPPGQYHLQCYSIVVFFLNSWTQHTLYSHANIFSIIIFLTLYKVTAIPEIGASSEACLVWCEEGGQDGLMQTVPEGGKNKVKDYQNLRELM